MDIREEFHREASPDNLEEEVTEDPIDPLDSDMRFWTRWNAITIRMPSTRMSTK